MAVIVIEASLQELSSFHDQHRKLEGALRAAGNDVRHRPAMERRDVGQALFDVVVRLLDTAEDAVVEAIVALIVVELRGRRKQRRKGSRMAVLYGPDGRELRRFELPE